MQFFLTISRGNKKKTSSISIVESLLVKDKVIGLKLIYKVTG